MIIKKIIIRLRLIWKRAVWNKWYDHALCYEKERSGKRYAEEIAFLEAHKNDLKYKELIFPYEFSLKKEVEFKAKYDELAKHYYISYYGKNLYFPGDSIRWVEKKFRGLEIEQNVHSPHRYFTEFYSPNSDEIFIDVGSAEGKEALDIAEKVKKLYLIEADNEWRETLKLSFAPYMSKTEIISKFAGCKDDENTITIDSLVKNDSNERYFIKMDVEGHEMDVLTGMKNLLGSKKCKVCVTTYHKKDDDKIISRFFEEMGYKYEFSDGVALLINDTLDKNNKYPPYFRKAVIRASNYAE